MTVSSNSLVEYLKQEITSNGDVVSFARYMELALYHSSLGYYCNDKFSIGKKGDFITAPELSPLFGTCLARQCAEALRDTEPFILELGAGTGRLAKDLMDELKKQNQLPKQYFIYEISHELRKKQEQFLRETCPHLFNRFVWLNILPENFEGIIVANEMLDALPVHRFHISEKSIKECGVTWKNEQFCWQLIEPTHPIFTEEVKTLQDRFYFPEGYESEIHLHLITFLKNLLPTIKKGIIFFIDYGYGEIEYYHPERNQGTLTCFHRHNYHGNPLINPGEQDITAHINFSLIASLAADADFSIAYTSQAAFLLSLGLMDIATELEHSLSPVQIFKLHQAIKVLTMPTEMGERIKVMALSKGIDTALTGFQLIDRRRDL